VAQIEKFCIKNYRILRDVVLGPFEEFDYRQPLTRLVAVIGKNGSGKSTIFDAFGFLADSLRHGVEEACEMRGRGGFDRLRSPGSTDSIEFLLSYRENPNDSVFHYVLAIDKDKSGRPYVEMECLYEGPGDEKATFFVRSESEAYAWKGMRGAAVQPELSQDHDVGLESPSDDVAALLGKMVRSELFARENRVELADVRRLGIATLGGLHEHPRIVAFRSFLEGWYLSYFTPTAARALPLAGPQKRLSLAGDNIGNVVQYMEREHPQRFQSILDRVAKKIPGIQKIDTKRTEDGRLLLRFNNQGFIDPFYAQQMSDGTLKLFAYYLLLEDPEPPPFICIEEPENGLYPKLLPELAREFREHAEAGGNAPQIFVTTHQPYFVDALTPEEVWILEKGEDGFAKITHASDSPEIRHLVEEGFPLGSLWFSDYIDPR
jgi:predicted ATPase